MLKSFLLITLRALQRNAVYSVINISGLAVGLAASALILLWVADELSFDKFHENHERIYLVGSNHLVGSNQVINGNVETTFNTPFPLMDALRQRSGQITKVSLVKPPEGYLLSSGENRISKMGVTAAGDFLSMFSFKVLAGETRTVLSDPSSAVLTRSTALALFGSTDVVGKTFTIDTEHDLSVAAVLEDVPANSSLQFDFLLSSAYYASTQDWYKSAMSNWQNHSFTIFAELREGADAAEVTTRIAALEKENNHDAPTAENFLHPLGKWHLYGEFENGKVSGGIIEYVRLFAVIAIFVLVIACINFTNLATARSQSRAREVGIRKTIGSQRKQLIAQFIGESLIITSIAFLFAIVIIQLALPYYSIIVGKTLTLDFTDPWLYLSAALIIIITALLAGCYPAFYLSSFQPVNVLKGTVASSAFSGTFRKVLVTVQFAFSIFLVIGSIVIYQQIMHVKSRHVGYNKENLLLIWSNNQREQNYTTIKQQLLSSGLVESVTKSSAPITRIFTSTDGVSWPGKVGEDKVGFVTIATEYDFTHTMGIKMLHGRDFSPEVGSDTSAIIINKSALDLMGLNDPIGQKIRIWGDERTIVGVSEDVVMGSPYHAVGPLAMVLIPEWSSTISVRLKPADDLTSAVAGVEKIFKGVDPEHPLWHRFAGDEFQVKFQSIDLIARLALGFTVLAIFISCLGLFGLASFTAEQRTKEVGIRKILGASVTSLLILITKDFSKLVIIAFLITAPIAWWMIDIFLQQYPYRISPHWWVLVVTGISAMILTVVIVSTQAFKAARSNPVNSLRNE
jgi:putative ABC transport system permease protein